MAEATSKAQGLLDRLRYHERGYTEVEAAIARALISDPARAIREPIELLAKRANVSSGSVVRFARLMGYPGFRALKFALAAEGSAEPATASTSSQMELLLEAHARAIQFAARTLDPAAFRIAAEVLAGAGSIDIVGVGAASATARAAKFQFTIAGFRCRRIDDPSEGAAAASFLGPQGALLAISHSGRTRATVDAAHRARGSGACVIAVCSAARSPLATVATHVLAVESSQTRYATDELPFRAAHLAIVQALAREAFESTAPDLRASRRGAWAAARFDLRYSDDPGVMRSSSDRETLTD
ncbi:MurR/RpiR family transcriptional regulator [Candidatus Amarobacter glycogenicus]|uniref:MurR/RpiR family transcriptional regulator n=1 Tax=Candidatus Amarobacter glycogenicus TaxID=3140699 RepID=UPI002A0C709C|nr:MurR/RpiR family transcriptional regulator [Dehalococcoidia bacterium]